MILFEEIFGAMTAGLLVTLLCLVAASRAIRLFMTRRRERLAAPYREVILQLVAEPDEKHASLATIAGLDRQTWAALEPTVVDLAGKVKGDSRTILVEALLSRGALDHALARSTSPRSSRRLSAAATMGIIGTGSCTVALSKLAGDADTRVRKEAVSALGRCGDPGATPVLLAALRGRPAVPRRIVGQALLRLQDPSPEALISAVGDPIPSVAETAADVLGLTGALSAVPALLTVAAPGHPVGIRASAIRALGRMSAPQALQVLAGTLRELGPPWLRTTAAKALGQLGHIGAVPFLVAAIGDPDDIVAGAAAASLNDLGPSGYSTLLELASDDTRPGTRHARATLAFVERSAHPEQVPTAS